MPKQIRGRLLVALGGLWILSLGSMGCQIQLGYSILSGPLPSPGAAGKGTKGEQPTAPPATEVPQEVARASYPTVERQEMQGGRAPLPPVSVLPDLRAVDGPSLAGGRPESSGAVQVTAAESGGAEAQSPYAPAGDPGPPCMANPPVTGEAAQPVQPVMDPGQRRVPTELALVSHPPYMIEPPDILLLDAIRMVPRGPYGAQALDVLLIKVAGTLPNQPIEGGYTVGPDGTINLGFSYGSVRVTGLTLEEIQNVIRAQLRRAGLLNPQVAVGLGQLRGLQQVRGEHLVRQDGTISLGSYGCVYVTGLTIPQAKCAIERHLSQFLVDPEVSLDVFAYNSKVYYVILDGGGYGQQVFRFPIVGKETVLDAISHIQGLPTVASKRHIWVARPAPENHPCVQILPVDWNAITQGGATTTNYQIFPGDRVYVKADPLIALDNMIAKIVSPIQRVLGVAYLGASTAQVFRSNGSNGNATPLVVVP